MTRRAAVSADNSESPRDFKAWDAAEVVHVIRWWLSKTSKRKRLAMAVGGFAEVIQEVYLDLLKHPPRGGFALTTVICKQTSWTLSRMCAKICDIEIIGECPDVAGPDVVTGTATSQEQSLNLRQMLCEKLDSRTAGVVWERMQGATFEEIGERLGVSGTRARQIDRKGIHQLQQIAHRIAARCDVRTTQAKAVEEQ